MRFLRITVTVLFVVVLGVFIWYNVLSARTDKTYPVITIDQDELVVPLGASDADILAGVTAYDEKDGDLTGKLIVASISRFIEPGVSLVRYSVCDNDKHVSSASRRIIYENYTAPRFTLSSSLVFPAAKSIDIRSVLGVFDQIDGDISGKLIITADDYSAKSAGVYFITAKVTNSKGDMISRVFPVYVEDRILSAPEITLKNYILYLPAGEALDPAANLVSAVSTDGTDLRALINIDTDLDTKTPGMYEVHYRVQDEAGRVGHVMLLVIVEE